MNNKECLTYIVEKNIFSFLVAQCATMHIGEATSDCNWWELVNISRSRNCFLFIQSLTWLCANKRHPSECYGVLTVFVDELIEIIAFPVWSLETTWSVISESPEKPFSGTSLVSTRHFERNSRPLMIVPNVVGSGGGGTCEKRSEKMHVSHTNQKKIV